MFAKLVDDDACAGDRCGSASPGFHLCHARCGCRGQCISGPTGCNCKLGCVHNCLSCGVRYRFCTTRCGCGWSKFSSPTDMISSCRGVLFESQIVHSRIHCGESGAITYSRCCKPWNRPLQWIVHHTGHSTWPANSRYISQIFFFRSCSIPYFLLDSM